MKQLIFIFAFIFAGIAILPCQDVAASQQECDTAVNGHKAGDPHAGDASSDLCSPFCSCQCCHIHTALLTDASAAVFTAFIETDKDHFVPAMFSKQFYSIWHPPKA